MERLIFSLLLCLIITASVFSQSSGWNIDKPLKEIPNEEITGSIFGKEYIQGEIIITDAYLNFKAKGDGYGPVDEITIFTGLEDLKPELIITPDTDDSKPHVHMNFVKPGKNFPGTLMYTQEYSLKLIIDENTEKEVIGRVHLSLPDYKKSFLLGRFTALKE